MFARVRGNLLFLFLLVGVRRRGVTLNYRLFDRIFSWKDGRSFHVEFLSLYIKLFQFYDFQ